MNDKHNIPTLMGMTFEIKNALDRLETVILVVNKISNLYFLEK